VSCDYPQHIGIHSSSWGKILSASVNWGRKCEKGEEKKGKIRKDKDRGESEVKRVKYK
jgi:hypothetical protein